MRQVEHKAYDPNIISIGPYDRDVPQLQAMEEVKRKFLNRLFDPIREQGATFETLFHAMKGLEGKALACYSETLNLSSDEFLEILLLVGYFIIELYRDSVQHKTAYSSIFASRWMSPIFRRDLIMLENQISWFVLCTLFELTHFSGTPNSTNSLIDLALKFFNPLLMPRDSKTWDQSIAVAQSSRGVDHLLGLFRSSLLPQSIIVREKQPRMFRSVKELEEVGVKFEERENHAILDLSFTKGVTNRGLYRNIISKPGGLCNKKRNRWRAELVHNYFSNPWALISLISATLLLILTFIQTYYACASYPRQSEDEKKSDQSDFSFTRSWSN